jgi:hypothetical protein
MQPFGEIKRRLKTEILCQELLQRILTPKQGLEMTDGQTAKQNDGQTANDEQTAKNILQNDLYPVMYNYIKDTYNQKRV